MSSPEPSASPILARAPTRGDLFLYRVCRLAAVGLSKLLFPGRVVGTENLPPTGAYILAPVHRSYLDWLIVARVTRRRLRYIAKEEVWRSKSIGRLIEALGAFPVNRSGADREALERCRAVLAGGEPLVMFPEGTRRSGPIVEDLREGVAYLALRAGVPVVPIGIGGSEKAMPRGSVLPKPGRIDIVIGEPIWPRLSIASDTGSCSGESPERSVVKPVRVSRRATSEFSGNVGASIQQAFADAEELLETTTITGRPRR
ncbi:MAG: lysophospholipid acyltransferase family protein [Acidimicrobiales bacterium]